MPLPAIEDRIRAYLLEEVLDPEDSENLNNSSPLVSTGILDSIATLGLTAFLETEFGVALAAHEINVDNLDSIGRIAAIVRSKTTA